jgi:hypothetical protein
VVLFAVFTVYLLRFLQQEQLEGVFSGLRDAPGRTST